MREEEKKQIVELIVLIDGKLLLVEVKGESVENLLASRMLLKNLLEYIQNSELDLLEK